VASGKARDAIPPVPSKTAKNRILLSKGLETAYHLLALLELHTHARALLEVIHRAGYALAALLDHMRVNHRGRNNPIHVRALGMDRVMVKSQDVADLIE
jgi:hypothetical protein